MRAWNAEAGLDPDEDVTWYPSGQHRALLNDLLSGKCSLGGTYSLNYVDAGKEGVPLAQLRILINTGTLVHDHLLAHPGADPEEVAAITEALLAFDPQREFGTPYVGGEKLTGFVDGLGKDAR